MPRGDGTGPAGMGPMTGRAAGYCAGYSTPGFTNPVGGRGAGFGRGFGGGRGLGLGFRGGRGRGAWGAPYAPTYAATPAPYAPPAYGAAPTRQQEVDALNQQAQYFEEALGDIRKRIEELEADGGDK